MRNTALALAATAAILSAASLMATRADAGVVGPMGAAVGLAAEDASPVTDVRWGWRRHYRYHRVVVVRRPIYAFHRPYWRRHPYYCRWC